MTDHVASLGTSMWHGGGRDTLADALGLLIRDDEFTRELRELCRHNLLSLRDDDVAARPLFV